MLVKIDEPHEKSITSDLMVEFRDRCLAFLQEHAVGADPDSGAMPQGYSLHRGQATADLYGIIDAVYSLYTTGRLGPSTTRPIRASWAEQILDCQDEQGWFSERNLRGHSREHATAYAIGALRLLEIEAGEVYIDRIKPLAAFKPLLQDRAAFERWLSVLDFQPLPRTILKKQLGWHYIWRGSHVGGGIPAAVAMTRHLADQWWPGQVDIDEWFGWYFAWLDAHASEQTGYWQRAFWNWVYRKPTLIDMGGAVHFFWVYEEFDRPFPYPVQVIDSTLTLQQPDGLYKDHPFCIDLDGDFCMIRAYLQLPEGQQAAYSERVYQSAEKNFEGIVHALMEKPLAEIYNDSHGLPGALVGLVECAKLPDFKYADALAGWQHPLDKVCWL